LFYQNRGTCKFPLCITANCISDMLTINRLSLPTPYLIPIADSHLPNQTAAVPHKLALSTVSHPSNSWASCSIPATVELCYMMLS